MRSGARFLDDLIPVVRREVRKSAPRLTWATVTAASPLRIMLDGETSALPTTPDSLVAGLRVGDRVRVEIANGRANIIGVNGGGVSNQEIPLTDTINFAIYTPGQSEIVAFRDGSWVNVTGRLRLLTAGWVDSATDRPFANLPEPFWPLATQGVVTVQQASQSNRWSLSIDATGVMHAYRYGPGSSTAGAWLPFCVTYPAKL